MHSALSNEIEKCSGVESLSGFEIDKVNVITGHKKIVPKFKMNNPKIWFSIHCENHRLVLAILPFFNESIFLMKNNYLIR